MALLFLWAAIPAAAGPQEDLQRAIELDQEATRMRAQGKYQQALPLAQEVLRMVERANGPDSTNTAAGPRS